MSKPTESILAPGENFRDLTYAEVKRLMILRRGVQGRVTYTWCTRCKHPEGQLTYWLERVYDSTDDYARFCQKCPNCGKFLWWTAIGWQPEGFEPKSSFYFARDSQRAKAYAWERLTIKPTPLATKFDEASTAALTAHICRELGIAPPRIEFLRNARTSIARGDYLIRYSTPRDLCPWIVIHELAHIFQTRWEYKIQNINRRHEDSEPGHGPGWVGIYIVLLERFGGLSSADLLASATGAGKLKCIPLELAAQRLEQLKGY